MSTEEITIEADEHGVVRVFALNLDEAAAKDQPFYHLLAENEQSFYVAYVSEQNLIADYSGEPVEHPDVPDLFGAFLPGRAAEQEQLLLHPGEDRVLPRLESLLACLARVARLLRVERAGRQRGDDHRRA